MKIEELTREQIEKIKALETDEERLDYLKECGVELDDDMLAEVAGGIRSGIKIPVSRFCDSGPNKGKRHKWIATGKTKKGFLGFGAAIEKKCVYCETFKWESA